MIATVTHHHPDGAITTHNYPTNLAAWVEWCQAFERANWSVEYALDDVPFIATKPGETVYATLEVTR